MERIIFCKLITIKEGRYTVYVFKDLENGEYLLCTKLPNWQTPEIFIGDEGFLQVLYVNAGEVYYNIQTGENTQYLYSNIYFKNFIKESIEIQNSEITL